MSKTEEKLKRKRQDDVAEDAPKKSKKSKKAVDPAAEEAPVVADEVATPKKEKKEKKDKKEKKEKKAKKSSDEKTEAPATDGTADHQEDFIPLGDVDEPMPDATNGTLSRTDSKKSKKDKKDKKDKKADVAVESEPAQDSVDTVASEEKAAKKKDKKSKKTKEATDDVEEQANGASEAAPSKEDKKKAKKEKKDKKEKKSKKSKDESEAVQEETNGVSEPMDVDAAEETAAPVVDKSKKDKKKSKKDKKAKEDAAVETTDAADATEEVAEVDAENAGEQDADADASEKKGRFIVFVGNLPFSATKETIEAHFAKLKPFEIRMRTYKKDNKFMGTCFIEFERFDRMQTALQKYHHSVFSDGTKKNERKINVELSAGGGGNTPARMDKIKAKNEKLTNERARIKERRDEVEAKQKARKEKKGANSKAGDEEAGAGVKEPAEDNSGMHPARLALLNQPAPAWKGNKRF